MTQSSNHPPHALGRLGEALAKRFLLRGGWTLEACNYRFGRREVDIVARRANLVVFVEVKTRSGAGYGSPEEAVTRLKRLEIESVAHQYLVSHHLADVDVRFDVIAVTVDGGIRIEHICDAWRPEPPR